MRIHVLQHAPFETEAAIGVWAAKHDLPVTRTRLYDSEPLPDIASFDLLCVMGGPMNIYEEDTYPFLKPEKAFLQQTITANKKTLGICLGAQLLADALGEKVFRNEHREIGWHPVTLEKTAVNTSLFKKTPERFHAFHWHGDTFSLPKDAVHLFSSAGCRNQGFLVNKKILGLQFHCEMRQENITTLISHCESDITPGTYVQSAEEMKNPALFREYSPVSLALMEQILLTFQKMT